MTKIPLSDSSRRFMQGVTAGDSVRDAHQGVPFPNVTVQRSMFWFYVGTLAVSEYGCKEQEDFEPFLLGAATRQPQEDDDEEPQ